MSTFYTIVSDPESFFPDPTFQVIPDPGQNKKILRREIKICYKSFKGSV